MAAARADNKDISPNLHDNTNCSMRNRFTDTDRPENSSFSPPTRAQFGRLNTNSSGRLDAS